MTARDSKNPPYPEDPEWMIHFYKRGYFGLVRLVYIDEDINQLAIFSNSSLRTTAEVNGRYDEGRVMPILAEVEIYSMSSFDTCTTVELQCISL